VGIDLPSFRGELTNRVMKTRLLVRQRELMAGGGYTRRWERPRSLRARLGRCQQNPGVVDKALRSCRPLGEGLIEPDALTPIGYRYLVPKETGEEAG
jgi:hypothetical protein